MLPSQKFSAAFSIDADAPKTLVENAYLALREDIIDCTLQPGARLRVEHLKDNYGVGAGTLREALSLLVSDALVTSEGQRGFRVAPISQADLEDITNNRVLLESEALKASLRAGDDAWEASLVGAYHLLTRVESKLANSPEQFREWELRNKAFHEALIAACDSRWLRYLIGTLYRQSERYRRYSLGHASNRNVHAEHQRIFDAAMARDAMLACAELETHIRATVIVFRDANLKLSVV